MSFDEPWFYAAVAAASGVLLGVLLAALARKVLGSPNRRAAVRAIANPTAVFLFWIAVAAGLVVALSATSPETLKPVPADILGWLPRALVAGLLILAGYAGGAVLASALGSAARRATAQSAAGLEKVIRWGVLSAAVVLALGNLGIQTTALQILVAGLVFTIGLSASLVAGLGGREVAANVAAARLFRTDIEVGKHIRFGDVAGTIVKIRPASLLVQSDDQPEVTTVIPAGLLLNSTFDLSGDSDN